MDDNILAFKEREALLTNLICTCERDGKLFEFKQGLDIRLLTPTIAKLLQKAPFGGEVIFAFDSLTDATAVRRGLNVVRKYLPTRASKCYVLCGYEEQDWRDVATVFRRLQILWESQTIGYVMRHENYRLASPVCRTIYSNLARWTNQPKFQRSMSFRNFCEKTGGKAARTVIAFEKNYPEVAAEYFGMKYRDFEG